MRGHSAIAFVTDLFSIAARSGGTPARFSARIRLKLLVWSRQAVQLLGLSSMIATSAATVVRLGLRGTDQKRATWWSNHPGASTKIGRASCRERVYRYGEIWVVAETSQK